MITDLSREEVIGYGARVRAANLLEQGGYTLAKAEEEGQALTALLPKGFLDDVKAAMDTVDVSMKDRALQREEAKEATHAHHGAYAEAKVWRRTTARRCALAMRLGRAIPEGLLHISRARTAATMAVQVSEMVKLLEANRDAIPGTGVDELAAKGKDLAATLKAVDATKELRRLNELPNAVQEFYYQKGLLYVGIKAIHDAGQALHASDSVAASRYHLGILYRRGATRKTEPQPEPQPAPVAS